MRHVNIKIYGRVQGVGFRYWTQREARKLGIVGLVRNEPDGSVYVEAEATEEELNKFLRWCERGPWGARVEHVELQWASLTKNFTEFGIG